MTRSALAEAPPVAEELFSTAKVMSLTGASYRQADWWARCGWIPGLATELGSGSHRHWTPDMVETARWLYAASNAFFIPGRGGRPDLPKLADFVRRAAEAGIYP